MNKHDRMLTKAEVIKILRNIEECVETNDTDRREALKIAQCELIRRPRKYSTRHRGKAWTDYENDKLLKMFYAKSTISEICYFLGRTESGISSHLKRLGIIKSRKEIKKYLED